MRHSFDTVNQNSRPMTSLPTVQITIMLTRLDAAWVDADRDRPPILGLNAGAAELCLVLPADEVTAADVLTVRQLAEVTAKFATDVERRYASQPR